MSKINKPGTYVFLSLSLTYLNLPDCKYFLHTDRLLSSALFCFLQCCCFRGLHHQSLAPCSPPREWLATIFEAKNNCSKMQQKLGIIGAHAHMRGLFAGVSRLPNCWVAKDLDTITMRSISCGRAEDGKRWLISAAWKMCRLLLTLLHAQNHNL